MMRTLPTIALLAATSLCCAAAGAQETPPAQAAPAQAAPAKGAPADLCAELLAFVKTPEAPPQPATAPPQQATAVSAPANKDATQPSTTAGETQQKSGLSGPVPSTGPSTPPSFKQTLSSANLEAKAAAPPGTPKPAPKPDEAMIAKVEAAAGASDLAGCRAAAQGMRKAGVALPAPLLALSALDQKAFAKPE